MSDYEFRAPAPAVERLRADSLFSREEAIRAAQIGVQAFLSAVFISCGLTELFASHAIPVYVGTLWLHRPEP